MWSSIKDFLRVYGVIAVIIAAALAIAWQFVAPAPPRSVVIASGPEGGAYHTAATRWAAILAREGIHAEVLATRGTVENLDLLRASPPRADLALLQGGVGNAETHPGIASLGAIGREAVWVFRRVDLSAPRFRDLSGIRMAVGPEGSGTRVLAQQLIAGAGLVDTVLLPLGGTEAAEALLDGRADGAVFVSAVPGPAIDRLIRDRSVVLVDFAPRLDAYLATFPFLTSVRLPAGSVSLIDDVPAEDVILLAPVVQAAVREDMHPQIVQLVIDALTEVHGERQFFSPAGTFPAAYPTDWQLHVDAARHYRYGPSFLKRYLPFWVAVTIERAWVLLIPVLTLLIPLSRIGPPLFRWQLERKIYRGYREVRDVERIFAEDGSAADRTALLKRLDRLAARVATVHVPLSYARPLYDLRQHIAFVRGVVSGREPAPEQEGGAAQESRPTA